MTKTTAMATMQPTSLQEAMQYAEVIAKADNLPKGFRGKPADILVAVCHGAELGLSPYEAMNGIAVINGRPTLWGDAMLAVAQSHRDFEDIIETFDVAAQKATCIVKRRGRSDTVQSFSAADAKTANLWGKGGTWSQYPQRMLQMRARSWALRDAFADALRGIQAREEVEGIEPKQQGAVAAIVSQAKAEPKPQDIEDAEIIDDPKPAAPALPDVLRGFGMAETEAELKSAGIAARGLEGDAKEEAAMAYRTRREQLQRKPEADPNDFDPPPMTDEEGEMFAVDAVTGRVE
jgi:hypothetical protein